MRPYPAMSGEALFDSQLPGRHYRSGQRGPGLKRPWLRSLRIAIRARNRARAKVVEAA